MIDASGLIEDNPVHRHHPDAQGSGKSDQRGLHRQPATLGTLATRA
jgi:hypothetical protein